MQGDTVRIRLSGQATLTRGVCKARVGPRSYEIQVGGAVYRRNRSHIIPTKERAGSDLPLSTSTQEDGESNSDNTSQQGDTSPESQNSPSAPRTQTPTVLRRSDRTRRPPRWMDDYIPS